MEISFSKQYKKCIQSLYCIKIKHEHEYKKNKVGFDIKNGWSVFYRLKVSALRIQELFYTLFGSSVFLIFYVTKHPQQIICFVDF